MQDKRILAIKKQDFQELFIEDGGTHSRPDGTDNQQRAVGSLQTMGAEIPL